MEDALNTLVFNKKRIAAKVEKLLRSAVENANYLSTEKNLDVDLDNLYVKHAVANDGPRMKRIRPAPMGRAFRYHAAHCAYRDRAGGAREKRSRSGDGCRRRASGGGRRRKRNARQGEEEVSWQEESSGRSTAAKKSVSREIATD